MTAADVMDVVAASRMVGVIEITPELAKRHTPAERTWFGLGGMDPGAPNFSPAEFTRSDRIGDEAREIHRAIQWTSLRGGIRRNNILRAREGPLRCCALSTYNVGQHAYE
jgi:hypothetical protein